MDFLTDLLQSLLLNPAVQAILIGFIFVGISWVVKTTKTKKDDAWWRSIQGAAISAFNIAEKAIPDDAKNKTLAKIDKALKEFNVNVANRFNRDASKTEIEIAQDLWADLALELKKK